jgi:hypothetical protein
VSITGSVRHGTTSVALFFNAAGTWAYFNCSVICKCSCDSEDGKREELCISLLYVSALVINGTRKEAAEVYFDTVSC